jgi:hypothetical protein
LEPLTEKPANAEPLRPKLEPKADFRPTQSPAAPNKPKRQPKLLGDRIKTALEAVGVTEDKVSKWLGRPCGCSKRRRKLNALDAWARRQVEGLFGSKEDSQQELEDLIT